MHVHGLAVRITIGQHLQQNHFKAMEPLRKLFLWHAPFLAQKSDGFELVRSASRFGYVRHHGTS
jgi:hypothetical protein